MSHTYYSTVADPASTAQAYGRDMPCSPKSGRNVARAIKGMPVARAKLFLEAQIVAVIPDFDDLPVVAARKDRSPFAAWNVGANEDHVGGRTEVPNDRVVNGVGVVHEAAGQPGEQLGQPSLRSWLRP